MNFQRMTTLFRSHLPLAALALAFSISVASAARPGSSCNHASNQPGSNGHGVSITTSGATEQPAGSNGSARHSGSKVLRIVAGAGLAAGTMATLLLMVMVAVGGKRPVLDYSPTTLHQPAAG